MTRGESVRRREGAARSRVLGRVTALALALFAVAPASLAESTPPEERVVTQGSTAFLPRRPLPDINSASSLELQLLKGIGPKRAAAIIAGRPYAGTAELRERGILPAAIYAGIEDHIVIGGAR